MNYTPDDYNQHDVLKTPALLILILLYQSKHVLFVLLPNLPRMGEMQRFLDLLEIASFDWGLLFSSLPAVAILVITINKRVPKAGLWPRWIWKRGRTLVILLSVLEIGLLALYVAIGKREFNEAMLVLWYIDLLLLIYLFRSKRVRDVFNEFPVAEKTENSSVQPQKKQEKNGNGSP
ncbi:MAG: DUF2919 domain-containing protein [Gammaproteobacteria bacterium]|nr:DUF2919 domain-containing protein [Gammaproteobacteria bacterium]